MEPDHILAELLRACRIRPLGPLDLLGCLILPLQHMVRCKLLLQQALKLTHPLHAEAKSLQEALHCTKQVNVEIDRGNDWSGDVRELYLLVATWSSQQTVDIPFVKQHRRLIRSGEVHKMRQHRKEPRQLFLFSDVLLYGSCGQPDLGVVIRGHMEVAGMSVVMCTDPHSDECGITVTSSSDTRVDFICASRVHAVTWVNDISAAARDAEVARQLPQPTVKTELPTKAEVYSKAAAYDSYQAAMAPLKQGCVVLKYNNKDGKQNQRFLRVSYDARQIEWGESSSRITSRLSLDSVRFLQCGPAAPAFNKVKKHPKQLDTSLCFSIGYSDDGGKDRTLDLQVLSDAHLLVWVLGLQTVLGASSVDLPTLQTFVRSCRDYGDYEEPLVIRIKGMAPTAPAFEPRKARAAKVPHRLTDLHEGLPLAPDLALNDYYSAAPAVGRHTHVEKDYHEGPLEQRLARFYAVYAPEKLGNVADIVRGYAGAEDALHADLRAKYNDSCELKSVLRLEAHADDDEPVDGMAQRSALASMDRSVASLAQRLAAFYEHYAPDKVPFADEIASSYAGREGELQRSLRDKYGDDCSLGGPALGPASRAVSAADGANGYDALLAQRPAQLADNRSRFPQRQEVPPAFDWPDSRTKLQVSQYRDDASLVESGWSAHSGA